MIFYDETDVGDDLEDAIGMFFEDFLPEGLFYQGFTFAESRNMNGTTASAANLGGLATTSSSTASVSALAVGSALAAVALVGLIFLIRRSFRNRSNEDFSEVETDEGRDLALMNPSKVPHIAEGGAVTFPVSANSLEAGFEVTNNH